MHYIVLDFEFNQFFPFKKSSREGTNPICPFEIIQIGAVRLDENLEYTGNFNIYIKPQIYKKLHPFVEKITGITPQILEEGTDFKAAYREFLQFIGGSDAVLCTWGIDDIKSLYRNIIYHRENLKLLTDKYINVQNYASKFLNTENGSAIGLKNAAELLNIHLKADFHDALGDARYTAEIFKAVMPKSFTPNVFDPMTIVRPGKISKGMSIPSLFSHCEKKINRPLTEEEKIIVKEAFVLGRKTGLNSAYTAVKNEVKKSN